MTIMTDHDSVGIKEQLPFQIYCEYFAYYRTWNKQAKSTSIIHFDTPCSYFPADFINWK